MAIKITSDEDAFNLLKDCLSGANIEGVKLEFENWPNINIHLDGKQYDNSITPSVMKGLLELQKSIYESYAVIRYGERNSKFLSADEREQLEIVVKVSGGSSDFDISLQPLLELIAKGAVDKMEPIHIIVTVLGAGLIWAASSSYKTFLENRKQTRLAELNKEEKVALIDSQKFAGKQETERAAILAAAALRVPEIAKIKESAEEGFNSILRSGRNAESADIQGVHLEHAVVNELARNPKKDIEEVRLDADYRIVNVDSSDITSFKVKIRNPFTGDIFRAVVQDSTLNENTRAILAEGEWARKLVHLSINARFKKGEYFDAVIVGIKKSDKTE